MSKRIAVLNNYSFERVKKEVSLGLKPAHHLYGVDELERLGYKIVLIDPDGQRIWFKIGQWLSKIPFCDFGDLGIQVEALKRRREFDLIYAPCQNVTLLLGLLSYFGL